MQDYWESGKRAGELLAQKANRNEIVAILDSNKLYTTIKTDLKLCLAEEGIGKDALVTILMDCLGYSSLSLRRNF